MQKKVSFPKIMAPNWDKINSQSLEDTQVEYISQKYTLDKYTFGKYTFGKYTFEKYALRFTLHFSPFTFHFSLRATRDWKSESVTNQRTYKRTWVGARDTCVSKKF